MSRIRCHSSLIILPLLLLFIPHFALAADVPQDNSLDIIIKMFQSDTLKWEPVIHRLTLGLFWGLVLISFTWSSMEILLKDGGLVDVLADLVRRTLTVGFCVFLLNTAADLARSLIASFQEVGTQISGGAVTFSPSNVVELGMNIVSDVWHQASAWSPVQTLMYYLAALIILVCFAFIAKDMVILIVTAFVTVSGGIVMMGFLGSEWTRENAINYFTAVLGIAVKMFVMQLIFGLGYGFIHDWSLGMSIHSSDMDYLALVVVAIVLAGMIREIPQIAASLASGRFTMAGGGLASAIGTAAAVTAGVALAATGAGVAGYEAMKGAMSDDDSKANDDAMTKMAIDTTGTEQPPSGGGGGSQPPESPPDSGGGGGIPEPPPPSSDSNFQSLLDSNFGNTSSTSSPSSSESGSASASSSDAAAPSSGAGGNTGGKSEAPAGRSTGEKLASAAGAVAKGAGGAALKGAKSVALHGAMSLAQKNAIGAMFARAGVDMMKPDMGDSKARSMDMHKKLMAQLQKDNNANLMQDDGNNPNNYRNVTEDEDERRERHQKIEKDA